MVCPYPHEKGVGGVKPVRHFVDKGVNFSRFCADVLYGWPLTDNFEMFYFYNKLVEITVTNKQTYFILSSILIKNKDPLQLFWRICLGQKIVDSITVRFGLEEGQIMWWSCYEKC